MKENKCPSCGRINSGNANFCKKCGAPLQTKETISTEDTINEFSIHQTSESDGPTKEVEQTEVRETVFEKDSVVEDKLPEEVECFKCGAVIELEEKERIDMKYTCPSCNEFIDMSSQIPIIIKSENKQKNLMEVKEKETKRRGFIFHIIIPMFSSIVVTLLFQKIIDIVFYYKSFIYRLFLPTGDWYQRIVPSLILFLFFWVLIDLGLKLIFLISDKRHLKNKNILNIPEMLQTKNMEFVLNQLNNLKKKIKKGRVFRIIYSLLDTLNSGNDVQRSHEFFRHQTDIESDTTLSGYTISRIFIWAMPILGFIGTVIGISLAVEHFSGFLTGDIDKIEIVKRELSNVARGLSFAFDTTLLGLAASLIAMLLTSFIQRNEEGFLTDIEELGLDIISGYQIQPSQSVPAAYDGSISEEINNFKVMINSQTQKLAASLDSFNNGFRNSSQEFVNKVSQVPNKIAEHEEAFRKDLESWGQSLSDVIGHLIQTLSTVDQNLAESLKEVPDRIQENENLIKGQMTQLQALSQQFAKTFQESIEQFHGSTELLRQKIESLSDSQKITIHVINTLDIQNKLLKEMQEAQEKTVMFLKNLNGPFEVKFVPSQSGNIFSKIIKK